MTAVAARRLARAFAMLAFAAAASTAAADTSKVLRIALPKAETGFDPAQASEVYSGAVIAAIMEPLLNFDYLARPVKLVPLTAEALPSVDDAGRRYTFKLRKGIYFAADPAFRGKRRELTAADYVYSIERLVDPKNRSPNAFHVAGRIVGPDARAARAKQTGAFGYGAPVAGLKALDRHTLQSRSRAATTGRSRQRRSRCAARSSWPTAPTSRSSCCARNRPRRCRSER